MRVLRHVLRVAECLGQDIGAWLALAFALALFPFVQPGRGGQPVACQPPQPWSWARSRGCLTCALGGSADAGLGKGVRWKPTSCDSKAFGRASSRARAPLSRRRTGTPSWISLANTCLSARSTCCRVHGGSGAVVFTPRAPIDTYVHINKGHKTTGQHLAVVANCLLGL